MDSIKKYEKLILLLFIATFVLVVLLIISIWNTFTKVGVLPTIFFILSIIGISGLYYFYRLFLKGMNIEEAVSERVAKERQKIMDELNKEKEKESDEDNRQIIEERVTNLIPKGNIKSLENYCRKVLENLADELNIVQGIIYIGDATNKKYSFIAGYALTEEAKPQPVKPGENIAGQAVKDGELMVINDIPENYFQVESGLGKGKPGQLAVLPVVNEKSTVAVIEIATFMKMGNLEQEVLKHLATKISKKLIELKKS